MRKVRGVVAVVAVLVLAGSCAGTGARDVAQEGPTSATSPTGGPDPTAPPSTDATPTTLVTPMPPAYRDLVEGDERTVAIYAAVIRKAVTGDHRRGRSDTSYRHIWVVDRAFGLRGGFVNEGRPGPRFSEQVKDGVRRELADLPPLEFVAESDDARRLADGASMPKKDGVIVTLGEIQGDRDRTEVAHQTWCGNMCAGGLTYVLAYEDGAWAVTGDTGAIMVS